MDGQNWCKGFYDDSTKTKKYSNVLCDVIYGRPFNSNILFCRSEPALELVVEDEFDEEDDQNQLADQVRFYLNTFISKEKHLNVITWA